ncbi:iron-sulfur cluster co-chaperone HscB C-terminal domain-containing protein [Ferruginibacter sp. HRS2-29]|uniref:iron-sulfur cluster co-chaperone HscB C-terminal domain-containing protein n=1 Tax=Ferruginibacter sp. HRS2-29 TaxID=2487334 RepID=UPI0020CDDDDB|nr:iron-sulfur cluster co-chaperone HscB C-terminal domain-containing protein [Ferruginibacter sp. HRS2-29]MCP9751592.1 hypothetical protein [Ferruginibacter sp. HRS2-29]
MNYYELFDLPFAPTADHTLVNKKYFELQKLYHPDFFTQGSEEEKEAMLERSADVNKAYHIFRHQDRTLEYFLKEKAVVETDEKYNLPPDFLMEMMELNEALTEEDESSFRARVAAVEAGLDAAVAGILDKPAPTGYPDADLQELKAYHFKKKYLKRILDRLDD